MSATKFVPDFTSSFKVNQRRWIYM